MKKIMIILITGILFTVFLQADVYVRGILHFKGGYRYGINVPKADVVHEWWFGKDKVTYISTGWNFKVDNIAFNTDMSFTLDKTKQSIDPPPFIVLLLKLVIYNFGLAPFSVPPIMRILQDFQLLVSPALAFMRGMYRVTGE